jgi:predicted dehydrogenase
MGKFRIGLIGLGGVASAHLAAFRTLDEVEIVSVCDIAQTLAETTAREFGARAYTDYRRLVADGGVDLVLVLTPASTHRVIVEAVAAAGLHVFCEKPLAVTLADGEAMVAACDRAGVKLFYGSCYRFLPAIATARALIAEGAIGKIVLMKEQLVGGAGLTGYRELGPVHYPPGGPGGAGMGLVDHGIHLIDVFSWFVGAAPDKVLGRGQIAGAAPVSEFVTMSFPGDVSGHLLYNAATYSAGLPGEGIFNGGQGWLGDGSIAEAGRWEEEPGSISVHGTEGALRIFHYANALFIRTDAGLRQVPLQGRPAFGHFATQLEACIRAIRQDEPPPVGGVDGLNALKALLAVYR